MHLQFLTIRKLSKILLFQYVDLEHSRVARSNYYLLTKMGSKVRFVYPKYFEPKDLQKYKVETFNDLIEGIMGSKMLRC